MARLPPAADSEVEFIFQKAGSNDTVVLYGEIEGVFPLERNLSSPPPELAYDDQGALMFVVAVIVVYSLSMFFIVAALLRRKSSNKSLDGQVNQYIKGLEAAREQDKMDRVLRTRLRWPGNFIRFGFESYSASEGDPRSDTNVDSDIVTSSDESSFIEMPATTLSLEHANNTTDSMDKEDEDTAPDNMPPVYNIPAFLRRNRRHRGASSGDRPSSLTKGDSFRTLSVSKPENIRISSLGKSTSKEEEEHDVRVKVKTPRPRKRSVVQNTEDRDEVEDVHDDVFEKSKQRTMKRLYVPGDQSDYESSDSPDHEAMIRMIDELRVHYRNEPLLTDMPGDGAGGSQFGALASFDGTLSSLNLSDAYA